MMSHRIAWNCRDFLPKMLMVKKIVKHEDRSETYDAGFCGGSFGDEVGPPANPIELRFDAT
jgi:hypothetical protein